VKHVKERWILETRSCTLYMNYPHAHCLPTTLSLYHKHLPHVIHINTHFRSKGKYLVYALSLINLDRTDKEYAFVLHANNVRMFVDSVEVKIFTSVCRKRWRVWNEFQIKREEWDVSLVTAAIVTKADINFETAAVYTDTNYEAKSDFKRDTLLVCRTWLSKPENFSHLI